MTRIIRHGEIMRPRFSHVVAIIVGLAVLASGTATPFAGTISQRSVGSYAIAQSNSHVLAEANISPAITARGGATLFVSDIYKQAVYIYNVAGKLTGTLTGFKFSGGNMQNLAVDSSGSLYVADYGNDAIKVYAPPYNGAPMILADDQAPLDVAVDASGDVAAGNNNSISVSFYAKDATRPTNIVSASDPYGAGYVQNVAFDAEGNLYLDADYCLSIERGCGFSAKGEIRSGIDNKTGITVISNDGSNGVAVTTNGLIAYDACTSIYSYEPPVDGKLGDPVKATQLSKLFSPTCTFALSKKNDFVFAADAFNGTVSQYAFPAGGAPLRTFYLQAEETPLSIAVNPAAIP